MWGGKKSELPKPAAPNPKEKDIERGATPGASPKMEEIAMGSLDAVRSTVSTARLGPSLHVKGEISGDEDLQIDGTIEGVVHLEDRKLTVGASARVAADIVAREVVVYGNVKGNLEARDRIEIKKDGSVEGDLTTARIMIEDGAYFKGSIEIHRAAIDGVAEEVLVGPPAMAKKTRMNGADGESVSA
jgi:cytoskeletal protein CcmA (bactofilin family)